MQGVYSHSTFTTYAGRLTYGKTPKNVHKQTEFSNHLGNVLVTISDVPLGVDSDTDGDVDYYMPDVKTTSDYEPFGAPLKERTFTEQQCSTYTAITDTTDVGVITDNFGTSYVPGITPSSTVWYRYTSATGGNITGGVLYVNYNASGSGMRAMGRRFTAVSGKTYSLTLKTWKASASDNNLVIHIVRVSDGTDVYTSSTITVPVGAGSPLTVNLPGFFTAPDNAEYVLLLERPGGNNVSIFIDDLSFTYAEPVYGTVTECHDNPNEGYRFAFNGKEKTDEWNGEGNIYDYGFRIYDPRIGKFLSVDPLTGDYPWYTPYQFAGNNPIKYVDLDGLEQAYKDPCSDYIIPASDYLNHVPSRYEIKYIPGGVVSSETIVEGTVVDDLIAKAIALPIQVVGIPLNTIITGQTIDGKDATLGDKVNAGISLALLGAMGEGEGAAGAPGGMKPVRGPLEGVPIEGAPVEAPYAPKDLAVPNITPAAATPAQTTTTAAVNLEARATAIHQVLPKITQSKTTVAAAEVVNAEGVTETWIASSEYSLRPAQRAAMKSQEVLVKGQGHAEATIVNAAKTRGAQVVSVAASRPICSNCATTIAGAGAKPASALKAPPKTKQ